MSSSPSLPSRHFASDNFAGICPEAWAAMAAANVEHAPSYGEDHWNEEAARLVRDLFETECDVFFVFTGTAANSLAVATCCAPFESALCSGHSHLISDECNATGFFAHGVALKPLAAMHGKVAYQEIERLARKRTDIHHSRVRMVSIAQSTELGTVYSVEELATIGTAADQLNLRFHMDGARFANAVAALGVPPRAITWEVGVDVLSFGGAKNGLAGGEALVFFDRHLARDFAYRRKQSGQLASKMRFLAAPWIGLLKEGVWLRNAAHANAMAAELETGLRKLPGVQIAHPREANAVFAELPAAMVAALHGRGWHFYNDIGPTGAARLMCAWDTRPEDVQAFLRDAGDGGAEPVAK